MKSILILIPAFNEEQNLPVVLQDLKHLLTEMAEMQWNAKIIVIDDGSVDMTARVAAEHGAEVIRLAVNLGYGAALQTGFLYAIKHNFNAVITIDADGQHQPKDILKLLNAYNNSNCDVVLGSRFIENNSYKTHWLRRLGIMMFSLVLRVLSGNKIADVTTGFQLLSRRAVELFAREYPYDYPDAQVLLLLCSVGLRIKEVPVEARQRLSGRSMHSFLNALLYPFRNLLAIFVLLLRVRRIKHQFENRNNRQMSKGITGLNKKE